MDGLKFYQYEMLCVYNLAAAGNTTWLEEIFYFKYHVLTKRCSIFSHWYLYYVMFSVNVKVLSVSFEKKKERKKQQWTHDRQAKIKGNWKMTLKWKQGSVRNKEGSVSVALHFGAAHDCTLKFHCPQEAIGEGSQLQRGACWVH